MDPWRLTGPERRGTFEDIGTATVFLVSLVLIVAVSVILFSGMEWSAPSLTDVSKVGQAALGSSRPTVRLAVTPQARAAQPVANADTAPVAGTQAATSAQVLAMPTATATPLAPTVTPSPPPSRLQVANTDGVGVYLRRTPRLNDRLVAWPDRTLFEVIGEDVDANGVHWKHVRDPRGNEGYIPSQYTAPER